MWCFSFCDILVPILLYWIASIEYQSLTWMHKGFKMICEDLFFFHVALYGIIVCLLSLCLTPITHAQHWISDCFSLLQATLIVVFFYIISWEALVILSYAAHQTFLWSFLGSEPQKRLWQCVLIWRTSYQTCSTVQIQSHCIYEWFPNISLGMGTIYECQMRHQCTHSLNILLSCNSHQKTVAIETKWEGLVEKCHSLKHLFIN